MTRITYTGYTQKNYQAMRKLDCVYFNIVDKVTR